MKTTTAVGTTATEAEVLAATAAAIEAGKDPFGDDDTDDEPAAEAGADDDSDDTTSETADDAGAADGELSAEALEAIAADEPAQAAPAAPRYKAGDPADFKAQRTALSAEKAKGLKDLMDGVIEPDAYSAIVDAVDDKLDALTVQRTLHEANVQTEQQGQTSVLDTIMANAKKAGEVDYAGDAKAAKQFDTAMTLLAQDGETRTYAQLAADAHKTVMAIRGIKPAPATKTAAVPRENGKGPMTLRNVPAAAVANTGGGWQEQMAALTGQAYEAAYAKLTQAQRDQLLND